MGLVKKGAQALGHDGAHVIHLQQLLQRRVHDGVELAKVLGQSLGGGFTDVANAQTKQKARQGRLLGFLQRRHDILGRFIGHAIQDRPRP